jgi:PAS domain S-box-containing protein
MEDTALSSSFDEPDQATLRRLLDGLRRVTADRGEYRPHIQELEALCLKRELALRAWQDECQELRRSRDHYAALFELTPLGYLTLDAACKVQDVNLAGARLLGVSRELAIGSPLAEFLAPGQGSCLHAHLDRTRRSAQGEVCELQLRERDGIKPVVSLRSAGQKGKEAGLCHCLVSDITEQRRTEAERNQQIAALSAQRTRQRFLLALERLSSTAIATYDPDQLLHGLLGIVRSEFRADRAWFLHPCDPGAAEVRVVAEADTPAHPGARRAGETIPLEPVSRRFMQRALTSSVPVTQLPLRDGMPAAERYGVLSQMATATRPRGDAPWLLGLHQCDHERTWSDEEQELFQAMAERLRDVLDAVNTRRALSESEQRFRETFEQAALGLAHVAQDGRFLRVNQSLCRMLGYDAEELLGLTCKDVTHPDDLAVSREYIARVVAGEGDAGRLEKRYLRKDGAARWANITTAPSRDARGHLRYLISAIEDITERKRMQERLAQNQDLLTRLGRINIMGEMASAIAHEVNQPLMAISLYAGGAIQRLASSAPGDSAVRPALTEIVKLAKRAGEVVQRLRDFTRQRPYQARLLDLDQVVRDGLEMLEAETRRRGVALDLSLAGGLPHVRGDAVQLQQVVINFILNGIEAMDELPKAQRCLRVSTFQDEDRHVCLEVTDTGRGFTEDQAEHLFQPLFTTKVGGTGLGLAIGKTTITAHGGRVWARRCDGESGAVFGFALPITEAV